MQPQSESNKWNFQLRLKHGDTTTILKFGVVHIGNNIAEIYPKLQSEINKAICYAAEKGGRLTMHFTVTSNGVTPQRSQEQVLGTVAVSDWDAYSVWQTLLSHVKETQNFFNKVAVQKIQMECLRQQHDQVQESPASCSPPKRTEQIERES